MGNLQSETEQPIQKNRTEKKTQKTEDKGITIALLGTGNSGKSTIFQYCSIHYPYRSIKDQTEYRVREMFYSYFLRISLYYHQDYNLKNEVDEFYSIQKNGSKNQVNQMIEKLFKNPLVQEYYQPQLKNNQVPFQIQYFLDGEFFKKNEINQRDRLLSTIKTTGLIKEVFSFKGNIFHLVDTGGQKNERKKWKDNTVTSVDFICYIVSLTQYNEVIIEDFQTNSMKESLETFENICQDENLNEKPICIFFNKIDLFKKRIYDEYKDFLQVFPDYQGDLDSENIQEFIKDKFVEKHPNPKSIKFVYGSIIEDISVSSIFETLFGESKK